MNWLSVILCALYPILNLFNPQSYNFFCKYANKILFSQDISDISTYHRYYLIQQPIRYLCATLTLLSHYIVSYKKNKRPLRETSCCYILNPTGLLFDILSKFKRIRIFSRNFFAFRYLVYEFITTCRCSSGSSGCAIFIFAISSKAFYCTILNGNYNNINRKRRIG